MVEVGIAFHIILAGLLKTLPQFLPLLNQMGWCSIESRLVFNRGYQRTLWATYYVLIGRKKETTHGGGKNSIPYDIIRIVEDFTSIQPNGVLTCVQSRLSESIVGSLLCPYKTKEIWHAIFCMGPTKAPKPDGFHALFFQRYWGIVEECVVSLCQYFLNGELSIWQSTKLILFSFPR